MRILSTHTLVQGAQSEENQTQIRIHNVKGEIVAGCHKMFDEMQERFGGIQSLFGKRQQKTKETLQSLQSRHRECAALYTRLVSRIDQIDDKKDVLAGDVQAIKNDIDGELPNVSQRKTYQSPVALFEKFQGKQCQIESVGFL